LGKAASRYRIAFSHPSSNPTVPIQSEQFIMDVLAEEPDKVQLHYCLGLINYYAKKDIMAARRDFHTFLSACPENVFVQERREAVRYIEQIDSAAGEPERTAGATEEP
jgi:hypothetical protein